MNSNIIKTFVSVIWSLVSLYVTHLNPLLLQPVSFALTVITVILEAAINTSFTVFNVAAEVSLERNRTNGTREDDSKLLQ